jgi:hypothetical protein
MSSTIRTDSAQYTDGIRNMPDVPDARSPRQLRRLAARARAAREPFYAVSRNTLMLNDGRPGTIRRAAYGRCDVSVDPADIPFAPFVASTVRRHWRQVIGYGLLLAVLVAVFAALRP